MKNKKQMELLAKALVEKCLGMIEYEDEDRNFVITHYDYDIAEFPELEESYDESFNEKLAEEIMKDDRVIECEIGTIEYCTTEIVFKDSVVREILGCAYPELFCDQCGKYIDNKIYKKYKTPHIYCSALCFAEGQGMEEYTKEEYYEEREEL